MNKVTPDKRGNPFACAIKLTLNKTWVVQLELIEFGKFRPLDDKLGMASIQRIGSRCALAWKREISVALSSPRNKFDTSLFVCEPADGWKEQDAFVSTDTHGASRQNLDRALHSWDYTGVADITEQTSIIFPSVIVTRTRLPHVTRKLSVELLRGNTAAGRWNAGNDCVLFVLTAHELNSQLIAFFLTLWFFCAAPFWLSWGRQQWLAVFRNVSQLFQAGLAGIYWGTEGACRVEPKTQLDTPTLLRRQVEIKWCTAS